MRRTFRSFILAFSITALPISVTAQTTGSGTGTQQSGQPGSMTGSATDPQTPGSGRTYGEINRPDSPGYETADRRGFDFGWLGLLGLAGLVGRRHANRHANVA
jgi:MYXO-CTERM domain-containing protein